MYSFILVVHIILAILIIALVLVQNFWVLRDSKKVRPIAQTLMNL